MGSTSTGGTPVAGKWMVSKNGGITPIWRGAGNELLYLSNDGMAMAVDVNTVGFFQGGIPKVLFKVASSQLSVGSLSSGMAMAGTAHDSPGSHPKLTHMHRLWGSFRRSFGVSCRFEWWAISDSNGGPSGCKPDALTAELTALRSW